MFWHLNPKKLMPFKKAYEKQLEVQNYMAWLSGKYVQEAISSCFAKNHRYPQEPYNKNSENNETTMTDAERFQMFALTFNARNKNIAK